MADSGLEGPRRLAPTQDQSSSQDNLHGWSSAPTEVHCMILDELMDQSPDNVAQYATVSREWQRVIEAATFRCLKVSPADLNKLATLGNRQHLVQKIWLHVELSGYKCCSALCDNSNELHTFAASNLQYVYIINQALVDLLKILVTWEPPQQIALELSVQSLSDNKHWFQNLSFGGTKKNSGLDSLDNPHRVSDGIHDCEDTAPPQYALSRLFRRTPRAPRLLQIDKPKVVKAFVIRRHTRRLINSLELKLLVESLIDVEALHWETWLSYESRADELHQAQDVLFVLRKLEQRLSAGESKVKRLSFLQDFNEDYDDYLRRTDEPMESKGVIVSHPHDGDLTLAGTFAQVSVKLTELYVSYAIDAADFLQSCTDDWRWESLEILVLTAPDLMNKPDEIPELLCTAAKVAYRMEKLQTMVL